MSDQQLYKVTSDFVVTDGDMVRVKRIAVYDDKEGIQQTYDGHKMASEGVTVKKGEDAYLSKMQAAFYKDNVAISG